MMIRELLPLPALAVLLAVCGTHDLRAALAQDYPTKPVRLIEPFGRRGAWFDRPRHQPEARWAVGPARDCREPSGRGLGPNLS